ncbi:MAG: AsmA family protein, partial [Candidatus Schmidhempelia sp.]|nr:AsmA family protein [Candidatus Schmidhempelia sp.]
MVKKVLLTLLILILITISGLFSLVFFVNPNHFRGFITQTVKDKTGYELVIDGDLRWHVWPQISI